MAYDPTDAANTSYSQDAFTADTVREEARNDSGLEEQRKAEARRAGVQDARFIGYSDVLENYALRSDVEHLADRRARHLAANPADQAFTRLAGYDGNKQPTEPADGSQTSRTDGTGAWTEGATDPGPQPGDPDYVAP